MRHYRIPDETVKRLPVYLRGAVLLLKDGKKSLSSGELAGFIGASPAQIRKDFSYFGAFGTRGVGYDTPKLIKQISKILKLNKRHKAVLVGIGNLGTAIMVYTGFSIYGFSIEAAFDNDAKKIGKKINGITIEDIAKLRTIRAKKIQIAILAVTSGQAQRVAESLVNNGIKGILNFSPCRLEVPKNIKVISIDIALDMARLPYYMPKT
ncbi:MAG: redox-sensing transcriptional repressor Rex [Phycisphaerae bacterium]|nr:redox-sensing transcriptional repressor Rex [Phycisphaerae bacterium]